MGADVLHLRGVVLPEAEERDLYVVDGRVTYEPVRGAITVADRGFVLPGLVDAHCHIGIEHGSPVAGVDDARRLAMVNRDAGVLAIRDAGSPIAYSELDDDVDVPRLLRAGRHLAPPKRYLPGYAEEVEAADLPDAAERQARAGNGWVKLVGDWIDRSLGDLAPTYDDATFAAAVSRAHGLGARVAVHTFSTEALPGLIAAGVDSVEHGTGLTTDLIDEMARRGIALVPTAINIATFPEIAERATRFPVYADRMRRLHDVFPGVLRAAYEAGVPIYVGSDAGGLAHGQVVAEIRALHGLGMTAEDALAAGSWAARTWLGLPGLEEGALADLAVYPEDPRKDLGVLLSPSRLVLRGRVVA
jgi:imidazolonepropionase-like amidohydrolase